MTIEIPRGSFVKFSGHPGQGRVEFISPLPCPFNYGFVGNLVGGDEDPLDAVVIGRRLARGSSVTLPVRAVARFEDRGCVDDKLVCSANPLTRAYVAWLTLAFRVYSWLRATVNLLARERGTTAFLGIEVIENGACERRG